MQEQRPDKRAATREELIEQHIGYARALARNFHRKRRNIGIEYEDYAGAAMVGLCDAAQRFDPMLNPNFKTYSYLRICGAMYDLLRNYGGINRACYADYIAEPREDYAGVRKRHKIASLSAANTLVDLGRLAVLVEDIVGICLYSDIRQRSVQLGYLEEPNPEDIACRASLLRYLQLMMELIPERERLILEDYYFRGKAFSDMSEKFNGVSRSWLSRLHMQALESLRGILAKGGYRRYEHLALN